MKRADNARELMKVRKKLETARLALVKIRGAFIGGCGTGSAFREPCHHDIADEALKEIEK